MLSITNKTAILSKASKIHNVRPETEEGDEDGDAGELVPAREYRLTSILLTKKQFEALVGDHAYTSFFNTGKKPAEPAFLSFTKLKLDDTYKNCGTKIVFGVSNKEIDIENGVKIKNLSVKFEKTGAASLNCTMVAIFPRNLTTLDLENFLGKEVTVSLRFGAIEDPEADKQNNLPLVQTDEDEQEAA